MSRKQSFFTEFFLKRRDIILPLALMSVALSMAVFISYPVDIFCRNLDEFRFALSDFLPFCILFCAVSAILIFAVMFIMPKPVYRVLFPILTGVALMFFIQGTYLNGGILYLTGDDMGNTVGRSEIMINLVIWIAVIIELTIIPCFFKNSSVAKTLFVVLCVILLGNQIVTAATALLTSRGAFETYPVRVLSNENAGEKGDDTLCRLSEYGITTLSGDDNIFVFCVDRFDTDYADEALKKCPEIFEMLDGFTYFNDNISRYGHTFPSVTYMLTNIKNDLPSDRKQYFKDAYKEAKTLSDLKDAGYSVNIYTDGFYAYEDGAALLGIADNAVASTDGTYTITDRIGLVSGMIRISLYRGFPFALKDKVGGALTSSSCNKFVKFLADYPEYTVDTKGLYETVNGTPFEISDRKRFSFIHFSGCHGVDYNENWETPTDSEKHDITISLKNSFKIIGKYIGELKSRGLYEDSTIIITGDHAAAYSDTKPLSGTRVTALFVKPKGAYGAPMNTSTAQVSHDNLWATIGKSAGIKFSFDAGISVFDVPENEDRIRRYVWHTTESNGFHAYTYEINGSARIFDNWKLTDTKESDTSLYN